MKKLFYLLLYAIVVANHWSCEKPDDDSPDSGEDNLSFVNTLSEDLTQKNGLISEYFYNFENNVTAEFFRYNPNLMNNYDSYLEYYNLFGEDPPTMNYHTFPDYLVSMTPVDSIEYTQRNIVDSLSVQDSIVLDSVLITSTPFKNLESLEWDLDAEPSLQRYKLVNSNWVLDDTMIYYADTFNVSAYWAVVDTPFIEDGLLFVDSSEWNDTNYVFIGEEPIQFVATFDFTKQKMSNDSLVFRVNTDCNDNGQWDEAEEKTIDYNDDGDSTDVLIEFEDNNYNGIYNPESDDIIADYNDDGDYGFAFEFEDTGNGILDPEEPYYDIDGDGEYDLNEPYQDRNCNDKWDAAETDDQGNSLYDATELYTLKDSDEDGENEKHLYVIGEKPDNLIVDWSDTLNPEVKLNLSLGDDIMERWGAIFTDVIEEIEFFDVKQQSVNDLDSLITLYTREKVGHVTGSSLSPDDYFITKSEWTKTSGGETERFYNYHIFHQPKHTNQVVYPSYFLPIGFYYSLGQIEDGFWHKKQLESEVLYYTRNGELREGEHVDTAYIDTTEIAVYFVEKSFRVEVDTVTVPAGNRASESDPAVDTTFTDCFKVTQDLTMTMVGSGVDFGQKTISWLAKNTGLVKSEIYIRWTEHPYNEIYTLNNVSLDENNEAWVGLNRLELSSISIEEDNGGVLRRLTNPIHQIELRDIKDQPDFDFDPFRVGTQKGIQTIDLRELSE